LLTSSSAIEEILTLAPEWQPVLDSVKDSLSSAAKPRATDVNLSDLFERLGAKALYLKASALSDKRPQFLILLRDHYYQPMLSRMLVSNQHLRRFLGQRKQPLDFQKSQAISMAVELAQKLTQKLESLLERQSTSKGSDSGLDDGFKVLLPAYGQRSVHNAVVDYIKEEWQWEKETLQDLNLDPEQEDPRQNTAADIRYGPEARILSGEQVGQLKQLRAELESMLKDKSMPQEPLVVVDCMFGLGLTAKSKVEQELTMREVCDLLGIAGETQARKIARCQVLLDKGLDMIRTNVRKRLPGLAECWQTDVNINTASRRELSHQLGLTEGEVEKLIAGRQYYSLTELVDGGAIKAGRVEDIVKNGAVACFVPVDLNACTTRDMIDILGLDKQCAQQITVKRPLAGFDEAQKMGLLDAKSMQKALERGAVLKAPVGHVSRLDINHASPESLSALGLSVDIVKKIERGRPFTTWGELEEYLCPDEAHWQIIRQKSCLTIIPC
jgi:DNA uptake protein ComE-like DNA-binding protein